MQLETVDSCRIIDAVIHRLHACLTAYEADTDKWEYKRMFRNEFNDLWICECANES